MSDWQSWLVAALLLFVAEMFAPGFWLACVAIGCLAAAAVGLLPLVGLPIQVVTFAVATVLSFVGVRPLLLRHFSAAGRGIRTNVDALIGKTGIVTERIDPGTRSGRVLVDGEDWRGASLDEAAIESGTRITVVQVDGNTLLVDKES